MDGLNIGNFSSTNYGRNIEVAFSRTRRTDTNGFICETHVKGIAVGFAVHGNGFDAELFAGTDDTKSDFSAIGNQDLVEHAKTAGLVRLMRADAEQRLSVLHWLSVIDQAFHHFAADIGLDLVHELHCFNNAKYLSCFNLVSWFYERRRAWRRGLVKRSHNGRLNNMQTFLSRDRRLGRTRNLV